MWNNLITPQPNKQISVVMPRQKIDKGTEIIVGEEAWYLIDYDQISIPTIGYYSFNEDKVNELKDSVEEGLANINTLQKWEIEVQPQSAQVGGIVNPVYVITKNGEVQNNIEPVFTLQGNLIFNDENKIVATEVGGGQIIVSYTDEYGQAAMGTIQVFIEENEVLNSVFAIEGDDSIRVTQKKIYSLISDGADLEVEFELEPTNLASIVEATSSSCVIQANERNKVGEIVLIARCKDMVITKNIQIISLWQVK